LYLFTQISNLSKFVKKTVLEYHFANYNCSRGSTGAFTFSFGFSLA